MDPLSDPVGADAGTKKKSSFQITSVRKGDTASLSSEVGVIDEFDVDPDEGDGEGDEDEDNLSGSISLDPGDSVNNLDHAGQTAPDVPQSQSKYKVVRIKKPAADRRYYRGRWQCWDYVDVANGEAASHLPVDSQSQDEERKSGNSSRKTSDLGEDSGAELMSNHEDSKRNGTANGGETAAAGAVQPVAPGSGKKVAFGPVATATVAATSAGAVDELSAAQTNRQQPQAADNLIAAVQDAVRKFSSSHQQELQSLKVDVDNLKQLMVGTRAKEKRTTADMERLTETNENMQEENRRLTTLVLELLAQRSANT